MKTARHTLTLFVVLVFAPLSMNAETFTFQPQEGIWNFAANWRDSFNQPAFAPS